MYQGKFAGGKQPEPEKRSAPVQKPANKKKVRRHGSPVVTALFYTFYFLMIAAFVGGTFYGLNWLYGWLTNYQAAQPDVKCQQVFEDLFESPDWADLYRKAGKEDSTYVNPESYAVYMTDYIGSDALTYTETSAGLSGDHKYIVRRGSDRVGSFTLTDRSGAKTVTDIPEWQLGEVEIMDVPCLESVRVETGKGQKVLINGEELDEQYIVSRTAVAAELDGYLPAGIEGPKHYVWEIGGMLLKPEVRVVDADGNDVKVVEADGVYIADEEPAKEISDAERTAAFKAAETFSLWMIARINSDTEIAKAFDRNTDVFKRIVSMRDSRWMQSNAGYKITTETAEGYISYSKKLCSVKVNLDLPVTRNDGTVKTYEFRQTLILTKQDGGWIATEMSNADLAEVRKDIHLVFTDGDAVLSEGYYGENVSSVQVPIPEAPAGKQFAGWAVQRAEDGHSVIDVVFIPDEDGNITLAPDTDGMRLFAFYE